MNIVILSTKSGDILDTIANLQLQSPEWWPVFGCNEAFKDIQYTIELTLFFSFFFSLPMKHHYFNHSFPKTKLLNIEIRLISFKKCDEPILACHLKWFPKCLMRRKILVFEFQSRKHLLFSIARGDLCCLSAFKTRL